MRWTHTAAIPTKVRNHIEDEPRLAVIELNIHPRTATGTIRSAHQRKLKAARIALMIIARGDARYANQTTSFARRGFSPVVSSISEVESPYIAFARRFGLRRLVADLHTWPERTPCTLYSLLAVLPNLASLNLEHLRCYRTKASCL